MKPHDESDVDSDDELDQSFVVTNIDGFMSAIIKLFNDTYEFQLLEYATPEQCKSIFLEEHTVCAAPQIITTPRHVDALLKTFTGLCVSGLISIMASEGMLDVAWDDEENDFVFKITPAMHEKLQEIKAQQK